jgi:outer membrane protein
VSRRAPAPALATALAAALLATALGAARSDAQEAGAAAQPAAHTALTALSLREAILLALEHNPSLRAQRLTPALRRAAVLEEQGGLDPVLTAEAGQSWPAAAGSASSGAEAGLSLSFATGTSVGVSLAAGWDPVSAGYDVEVTQALLAGGRLGANLARVRQARLDVLASEHELRGYAEALVAGVQQAYWDHYLALRQREIYRESLALAERQLEESRVRVQVGQIAPIELAAPRAELTSRREALREGEKRVETTRVALLLRINPPGAGLDSPGTGLDAPLSLADSPSPPVGALDGLAAHLSLALRRRPELLQARLALERGELEVARTRGGLLPRLGAFIALGGTGYAAAFADAVPAAAEDSSLSAGLSLELALGNRAARARAEKARLGRAQAEEALRALERTVEADVRSAWLEAAFAAERVSGSAELRGLQEEKLTAETEKFRTGSSTTYLVAQAQRDLLASQLSEAQAAVGWLLAVVSLYRLEGTLLERSGVEAQKEGS